MALSAFYLFLMAFTQPVGIGGDTLPYASDILSTLGHKWTDSPAIWNFSHILWRPLGRITYEWFGGFIAPHFGGDKITAIIFCMAAINFVAALVAILALYAVLWRLTGRVWISALVAATFAVLNPLLNYSRFGTPHVVGAALTTVGLYYAAFHPRPSWRTASVAGVLGALAASLWIQYVMSLPALLLAAFLLERYGKDRKFYLRMAAITCIAFGATLGLIYGAALVTAHIGSLPALMAWIREAAQDSREKKALRMITGMVRGVYETGNDAVWLKWAVFHDPYARVGIADLARTLLVKIALFYLTLGTLFVFLLRSRFGRRFVALIVAAMAGHIVMALSYESGSVERYLPFLPVLWLGFGWLLSSARLGAKSRIAAAVLCAIHIPFNLAASMEAGRGSDVAVARLSPLLQTPPHSRVWAIFYPDDIIKLRAATPFHPINRDPRLPQINMVQQTGAGAGLWREEFSCLSLSTLNQGGEVWITRRLLANEPKREWLWVEGDDPRLKWKQLVTFFRRLQTDATTGGDDGFFRVEDSPEMRAELLRNIKDGDMASCPSAEKSGAPGADSQ